MKKFLKKNNISLIEDFGIYFNDIEDIAVGVFAEDTNYMIRNELKKNELKIIENLKTLREWIDEENNSETQKNI